MSYSVLERTRPEKNGLEVSGEGRGFEVRRRSPVWLLLFFILVGFSIAVAVSLLAGSSPYGVLYVALVIGLSVPLLALMIQAAPEAVAADIA